MAAYLLCEKAAKGMTIGIKRAVRDDRNSMLKARIGEAAQMGEVKGLSRLQREIEPLVACVKQKRASLKAATDH